MTWRAGVNSPLLFPKCQSLFYYLHPNNFQEAFKTMDSFFIVFTTQWTPKPLLASTRSAQWIIQTISFTRFIYAASNWLLKVPAYSVKENQPARKLTSPFKQAHCCMLTLLGSYAFFMHRFLLPIYFSAFLHV